MHMCDEQWLRTDYWLKNSAGLNLIEACLSSFNLNFIIKTFPECFQILKFRESLFCAKKASSSLLEEKDLLRSFKKSAIVGIF